MIFDIENHTVHLMEKPNPHILVLGNSGYGKTYFMCRKMEEQLANGRTIFLLDYSASYTQSELGKNQFRYLEKTKILDPLDEDIDWIFRGDDFVSNLADALLSALRIRSYHQKKSLREAIKSTVSTEKFFSIPLLMKQLKSLLSIEEVADTRKNIYHLLTRLEPYSGLSEIHFLRKDPEKEDQKSSPLTIVQISDYPEIQRKFLVEFFAEIFWKEVRYKMKRADVILLDEFQNMDVKPGSALSSMLREGRKFGLSVHLSSQFFGNYDKEGIDTLMQAANKIFFRPTENDLKSTAERIDPNDRKTWTNILKKLQVGEAVVKGRYMIDQNIKELEKPIICNIR